MIHYHGTPITPRAKLLELAGRSFCVSFARPDDVTVCHEIGQSVLLDNGAFSLWTQGRQPDWDEFVAWAERWLEFRADWAIAPDVIDGDEEDNDRLLAWLFRANRDVYSRCAPVWHMHESLERLRRLCDGYGRVCVGSSGEYRTPGTPRWVGRLDAAFSVVCGNGPAPVWLHMLRAMSDVAGGDWPFASADSTNIARNHNGNNQGRRSRSTAAMADLIDSEQAPSRWRVPAVQLELSRTTTTPGEGRGPW